MTQPSPDRLVALDAFRGMTIAAMILVNNPGDWGQVYAPLRHAEWHGWTPTDLVFPFFLFIAGVAIPLAFTKRLERGASTGELTSQTLWRAVTLFGLGLFLAGYPFLQRPATPFGWPELGANAGFFAACLVTRWIARRADDAVFAHAAGRATWQRTSLRLLATLAVIAVAVIAMRLAVDATGWSWNPRLEQIRIPGVLQRIAICWAVAALLYLRCSPWQLRLSIGIALLGYWASMTLVPVPAHGAGLLDDPEYNLAGWLDRQLLDGHLWSQSKTWDPEGVLSTLPAIGTALLGVLTGHALLNVDGLGEKVRHLLVTGALLVVLGYAWGWAFPINKSLWTSSYVLLTAGQANCALALCLWFVDARGLRWLRPFSVYGKNAITVFVGSGVLAITLSRWRIDGTSAKGWVYSHGFESWLDGENASLAYAIAWVLMWFAVLAVLEWRRIVIRV